MFLQICDNLGSVRFGFLSAPKPWGPQVEPRVQPKVGLKSFRFPLRCRLSERVTKSHGVYDSYVMCIVECVGKKKVSDIGYVWFYSFAMPRVISYRSLKQMCFMFVIKKNNTKKCCERGETSALPKALGIFKPPGCHFQ